jgi:hypothetical protein
MPRVPPVTRAVMPSSDHRALRLLALSVLSMDGWMDGWIGGNEGELKLSVCLIVASLVRNSALSNQQLLNLIASD